MKIIEALKEEKIPLKKLRKRQTKNWKKSINSSRKAKKAKKNPIKQVKEAVQDLTIDVELIKKTQTKGILEMENPGKRTGTTDANITNRIQEMEESQALKI